MYIEELLSQKINLQQIKKRTPSDKIKIRRILPNIATVCIQNDSIAWLDSRNPSEYIVLRKAQIKIK